MRKRKLVQDLISCGFEKDEEGSYVKNFNSTALSVQIGTFVFGIVNYVSIYYNFKQELPEELHDEVWEKLEKVCKESKGGYVISSLGFEFFEVMIMDKRIISNISAEKIVSSCEIFSTEIQSIIDEYRL
ncbi:MAG: hypothetical protein IJ008_01375 [Clostridia bacterium]|nr:hypothetical protein [Clostridia bacterium]